MSHYWERYVGPPLITITDGQIFGGLGSLGVDSNYVYAGNEVQFMANATGGIPYEKVNESLDWGLIASESEGAKRSIEQALRARASAINAAVNFLSVTGDLSGWAIQMNVTSRQDRGSIEDIRGDLGSALTSVGNLKIRSTAIRFVKGGLKPGQNPDNTIPGAKQTDTYHDKDTILGNTVEFYLKLAAEQLEGMGQALKNAAGLPQGISGTMVMVGAAAVVILLLNRR